MDAHCSVHCARRFADRFAERRPAQRLEQLVRASRLYYELGRHRTPSRSCPHAPQVSRLLKRAWPRASSRSGSSTRHGLRAPRPMPCAAATARCRPPGADDRRSRGPHPADGRPPGLAGPPGPVRAGSVAGPPTAPGPATADALAKLLGDGPADPSTPSRPRSPPCGGYWSTARAGAYRRVAGIGAQAHGLMAPGLVDDAARRRL
jgi:hypothetical protein